MREQAERTNVDGRAMTEAECYAFLSDRLGQASDAARGLAHLRKDMRWKALSEMLVQCRDNAKLLLHKKRSGGLIIPARMN